MAQYTPPPTATPTGTGTGKGKRRLKPLVTAPAAPAATPTTTVPTVPGSTPKLLPPVTTAKEEDPGEWSLSNIGKALSPQKSKEFLADSIIAAPAALFGLVTGLGKTGDKKGAEGGGLSLPTKVVQGLLSVSLGPVAKSETGEQYSESLVGTFSGKNIRLAGQALKRGETPLPYLMEDAGNAAIVLGGAAGALKSASAGGRVSATGAARLNRIGTKVGKAANVADWIGDAPIRLPIEATSKAVKMTAQYQRNKAGRLRAKAAELELEDPANPEILDLRRRANRREATWGKEVNRGGVVTVVTQKLLRTGVGRAVLRANKNGTQIVREMTEVADKPLFWEDLGPLTPEENQAVFAVLNGRAALIDEIAARINQSPEYIAEIGRYNFEPGYSLTPDGARMASDYLNGRLPPQQASRIEDAARKVSARLEIQSQQARAGYGRRSPLTPAYDVPFPSPDKFAEAMARAGRVDVAEEIAALYETGFFDDLQDPRVIEYMRARVEAAPESVALDSTIYAPKERNNVEFYKRVREALLAQGEATVAGYPRPPGGTDGPRTGVPPQDFYTTNKYPGDLVRTPASAIRRSIKILERLRGKTRKLAEQIVDAELRIRKLEFTVIKAEYKIGQLAGYYTDADGNLVSPDSPDAVNYVPGMLEKLQAERDRLKALDDEMRATQADSTVVDGIIVTRELVEENLAVVEDGIAAVEAGIAELEQQIDDATAEIEAEEGRQVEASDQLDEAGENPDEIVAAAKADVEEIPGDPDAYSEFAPTEEQINALENEILDLESAISQDRVDYEKLRGELASAQYALDEARKAAAGVEAAQAAVEPGGLTPEQVLALVEEAIPAGRSSSAEVKRLQKMASTGYTPPATPKKSVAEYDKSVKSDEMSLRGVRPLAVLPVNGELWSTNSYYAYRIPEGSMLATKLAETGKGAGTYVSPAKTAADVAKAPLEDARNPLNVESMGAAMEAAVAATESAEPATILGVDRTRKDAPLVIVELPDGRIARYAEGYLNVMMTPGRTLRAVDPNKPAVIYDNGVAVGVIMPIRGEGSLPDAEAIANAMVDAVNDSTLKQQIREQAATQGEQPRLAKPKGKKAAAPDIAALEKKVADIEAAQKAVADNTYSLSQALEQTRSELEIMRQEAATAAQMQAAAEPRLKPVETPTDPRIAEAQARVDELKQDLDAKDAALAEADRKAERLADLSDQEGIGYAERRKFMAKAVRADNVVKKLRNAANDAWVAHRDAVIELENLKAETESAAAAPTRQPPEATAPQAEIDAARQAMAQAEEDALQASVLYDTATREGATPEELAEIEAQGDDASERYFAAKNKYEELTGERVGETAEFVEVDSVVAGTDLPEALDPPALASNGPVPSALNESDWTKLDDNNWSINTGYRSYLATRKQVGTTKAGKPQYRFVLKRYGSDGLPIESTAQEFTNFKQARKSVDDGLQYDLTQPVDERPIFRPGRELTAGSGAVLSTSPELIRAEQKLASATQRLKSLQRTKERATAQADKLRVDQAARRARLSLLTSAEVRAEARLGKEIVTQPDVTVTPQGPTGRIFIGQETGVPAVARPLTEGGVPVAPGEGFPAMLRPTAETVRFADDTTRQINEVEQQAGMAVEGRTRNVDVVVKAIDAANLRRRTQLPPGLPLRTSLDMPREPGQPFLGSQYVPAGRPTNRTQGAIVEIEQGLIGDTKASSEYFREGTTEEIYDPIALANRLVAEQLNLDMTEAFRSLIRSAITVNAEELLGPDVVRRLRREAYDRTYSWAEGVPPVPEGVAVYAEGLPNRARIASRKEAEIYGDLINKEMEKQGFVTVPLTGRIDRGVPTYEIDETTPYLPKYTKERVMQKATVYNPDDFNIYLRAASRFTSAFKNLTLPFSIAWQTGDIVGIFISAAVSGVNPLTLGNYMVEALRANYGGPNATRGQILRNVFREVDQRGATRLGEILAESGLQDVGLRIGEQQRLRGYRELPEQLTVPQRLLREATPNIAGDFNVGDIIPTWRKGMYRVNEAINRVGRHAFFLAKFQKAIDAYNARNGTNYTAEGALEAGLHEKPGPIRDAFEDTVDTANDVMGDWMDLSPRERKLVLPNATFYAWIKHVHKLFLKVAKENPSAIKWYIYLGNFAYDPDTNPFDLYTDLIPLPGGFFTGSNFMNPFADVVGGPLGRLAIKGDPSSLLSPLSPLPRIIGAGIAGLSASRLKTISRPYGTGTVTETGSEGLTPLFLRPTELAGFTLQQFPIGTRVLDLLPTGQIPGTNIQTGPYQRYETGAARLKPGTQQLVPKAGGRGVAAARLIGLPFLPSTTEKRLKDIERSAKERLVAFEEAQKRARALQD